MSHFQSTQQPASQLLSKSPTTNDDTAAVTQQQRSLPSLNAGLPPAMEKQQQRDIDRPSLR